LCVETDRYDDAFIRVSTDGSNWTTIWDNPSSDLDGGAWEAMEYDISEIADDQATVYIRWTMGDTDNAYKFCGWNIDDVEIEAIGGCEVDSDCIGENFRCIDSVCTAPTVNWDAATTDIGSVYQGQDMYMSERFFIVGDHTNIQIIETGGSGADFIFPFEKTIGDWNDGFWSFARFICAPPADQAPGQYEASFVLQSDQDQVGAEIVASCTVALFDETPPVISLIAPADEIVNTTGTLTFSCAATDNTALTEMVLYKRNESGGQLQPIQSQPLSGTDDSADFNVTIPDNGDYLWNCLATDSSGNSSFAPADWRFTIDQPPGGVYNGAVSNGDNDCSEDPGAGWSRVGSGTMYIGNYSSSYDEMTFGAVFEDVNIPQGAIINTAYLSFLVVGGDEEQVESQVFGFATDDAEDFTVALPSENTQTDNVASWSIPGTLDQWQQSPNLAPVIQEIIDRGGWVSGNALGLAVEEAGTSGNYEVRVVSYDDDADNAARLEIDWSLNPWPGLAGDYVTYLQANPEIAAASVDQFSPDRLALFSGYIDELINTDSIDISEPAASVACVEPEICGSIMLTQDEQDKIIAAKTAHAIWLDYEQLVSWRLADYSDEELALLFSPDKLLFDGNHFNWVVDHNPSMAYQYVLDNDLLASTAIDSFYWILADLRSTDDRSSFFHGLSSDPKTSYTLWDALTEWVPGGGSDLHRISRQGCHSMTRITIGLLRSINIPGEYITDGSWFSFAHSSAVWPALGMVMPHGDDVYNAALRQTPDEELAATMAFYEAPDNLAVCDGADDVAYCLGERHHALIATTYPADWTTGICCDPATHGYATCEEYLSETYSAVLTSSELTDAVTEVLSYCE
ncbi:MAG: hypothetical protein GY847_24155, partial [Proteobacteria bacterium]|nr:hypothetical protein [Pseudomonadota bacterium]